MGLKAVGAAQGYTVLGGIVLLIFALQMVTGGLNNAIAGDIDALIDVVLGIALVIMVVLAFDACGFINYRFEKSGLVLALIGFISIVIVVRGLEINIISWLTNLGTLAGFMILLAGILLMFRK
jgi:hypothetical protein